MSDTPLHNAAGEVTLNFWLETRATNSGTLGKCKMSHSILPCYVNSYTFITRIQQYEKIEIKNKNIKIRT
jgi:hypothetical protein